MTTPEEKDVIAEVCREDAAERSQQVGSIHQTPYGSISHYPAVAAIVTSDPREMQVKAPDARIGSVLMHGYDFKPVPTKFSEILALPDINELRQQLADVSHERDLLRAAGRWVPVTERLPLQAVDGQSFECVEVVITDGTHVHVTDFKAGGIPVAWSEFDRYAAISRSQITHWMPLPAAPSAEVKP